MSRWDGQGDGSYLGAASDLARTWANGDQFKHKLAAAGFAAWCLDMGLHPEWHTSNWANVYCDPYGVNVQLDTSYEADKFSTAIEAVPETWYAIVRILSGKTPVIHILGLTAVLDQIQRNPAPHPRHRLLSPREWLRAFPIHHTPYQETPA